MSLTCSPRITSTFIFMTWRRQGKPISGTEAAVFANDEGFTASKIIFPGLCLTSRTSLNQLKKKMRKQIAVSCHWRCEDSTVRLFKAINTCGWDETGNNTLAVQRCLILSLHCKKFTSDLQSPKLDWGPRLGSLGKTTNDVWLWHCPPQLLPECFPSSPLRSQC